MVRMMKTAAHSGLLVAGAAATDWSWMLDPCGSAPAKDLPYCNTDLTRAERASDLVARLTVEERQRLVAQSGDPIDRQVDGVAVPPMAGGECLHSAGVETFQGNHGFQTTVFPMPIALGAGWSKETVQAVAGAIAIEVRAKQNVAYLQGKYGWNLGTLCVAPIVNLARDPRWGRLQETYSEDTTHVAELGAAFVRGLRGNNSEYLATVPLLKHLDAYGGPENDPASGATWTGTRMEFDAVVSGADLEYTFRPAFREGVKAGALGVMCSYNAINGIPSCASRELLTDLLRDRWQCGQSDDSPCWVVSDSGAPEYIADRHHFVRSFEEAASVAVHAGCDALGGGDINNTDSVATAFASGMLTEADLDQSVRRLVHLHMMLGTFDPLSAVPFKSIDESAIASPANTELALLAARQAMTLLENKGGVLPLSSVLQDGVTVVGPAANDSVAMQGSYSTDPTFRETFLDVAQRTFGDVTFSSGCQDLECADDSGFAAAVDAARDRTAMVVVGTTWIAPFDEGYPSPWVEMEGQDRVTLGLPGKQEDLIRAVTAVAKKTIVVLIAAGPMSLPWVSENADALLVAYFSGQATAQAVVDVLTGAVTPSGKLPYTIPAALSDVPDIEDYAMSGELGRTYRYSQRAPLYPFGYGLSYTSFTYSDLSVSSVKTCGTATVSFTINNLGNVDADEVAQLYLQWEVPAGSNAPPAMAAHPELKDFARVSVPAGLSTHVELQLRPPALATVRASDLALVLAPGRARLFVGGGQPQQADSRTTSNILEIELEIDGDEVALESCEDIGFSEMSIVV